MKITPIQPIYRVKRDTSKKEAQKQDDKPADASTDILA
jgi:hypothetical protein